MFVVVRVKPSTSWFVVVARTLVVVGLVPSVCVAPTGKSGSVTSIRDVVFPSGTVKDQSPLASVITVCKPPKTSVICTSIFGRFGSPKSWVPLLLVS